MNNRIQAPIKESNAEINNIGDEQICERAYQNYSDEGKINVFGGDSAVQERNNKQVETKVDKRLKVTGLILIVFVVLTFAFMPKSQGINTSDEAKSALENHMSAELPLGVRIIAEDENHEGEDLTIVHSSHSDETEVHIWDYAAEDGDYVQILVDGTPVCDPFMIKHKPVKYAVPTTGEIQVLGTRDGGGGITYAIHYDLNGTTYFNGMDVGNGNLYTLIRE